LCVGFIALLITAIVLIAVSVKSIDANEVGLAVDGFSQNIGTKLYSGGTYFLGPAYSFVKYPTTQETVTFGSSSGSTSGSDGPALPARTSDGLPITVSFSFNYQLKNSFDVIQGLYLNYGTAGEVETLYQRISRNVVRTVAGQYPAAQFFVNKEVVRAAMQTQLAQDLGTVGALLQALNLLNVGVPTALSNAISRQQNAQQDVTRAYNDLQTAQINANTRVQANLTQAALIVSGASVSAQQTRQQVAAQISSLIARYNAERTSYLALKNGLNMTTPDLLSYIWLDAQSEAATNGYPGSIVNLKTPVALT